MSSLKRLFVLAFVAMSLLPLGLFQLAVAAPTAGLFNLYLPLTTQGQGSSTTPPTTTPPTTTPVDARTAALFLEPTKRVTGSHIAIDAQGGMHIAYYYTASTDPGPNVVYGYCPPPATNCGKDSAWGKAILPVPTEQVQLQLTPDGHPRILSARSSVGQYGGLFLTYTYAECNQNCVDAASWSTVEVTTTRQGDLLDSRAVQQRYFALDHLGHPRFITYDNQDVGDQKRYGTFYYACDANCTVADNWIGTQFTEPDPDGARRGAWAYAPVLKFTQANQPRVLAVYYPLSTPIGFVTPISYFACDSDCDDYNNWGHTDITVRGNGSDKKEAAWDLELDANDHPRAVVYHGETQDDTSLRLFYYVCDTNCLDASAWTPVNLGTPQYAGLGADLALDAQGNPRIAFLSSNDLWYSFCDTQCTQADSWRYFQADQTSKLDAEYPLVIPSGCSAGLWDNYGPNLALDPQGNPRLSYSAVYDAQCIARPAPGDPSGPTSGFYEIAYAVRVFFTQQK